MHPRHVMPALLVVLCLARVQLHAYPNGCRARSLERVPGLAVSARGLRLLLRLGGGCARQTVRRCSRRGSRATSLVRALSATALPHSPFQTYPGAQPRPRGLDGARGRAPARRGEREAVPAVVAVAPAAAEHAAAARGEGGSEAIRRWRNARRWCGHDGVDVLQLVLEVADLVAQVRDDLLVLGDVGGDGGGVAHGLGLDVLGAVRVLERVCCLLKGVCRRCKAAEHDGLGVAAQALLEEARELRVAVVDERTLLGLLAQGVDAVGQGEEGAVDVVALAQARAIVVGLAHALRTRQVDETQLPERELLADAREGLARLDGDGEHGVGSGRGRVGLGALRRAPRVPPLEEAQHLTRLRNLLLVYARHKHALDRVLPQVQATKGVRPVAMRHVAVRRGLEEIVHALVVDLDVGDAHFEGLLRVRLHHGKQAGERERHDSEAALHTCHGVGLARSRGAIGEDRAVDAREHLLHEVSSGAIEDLLLRVVLAKGMIEAVSLLTRPVRRWPIRDVAIRGIEHDNCLPLEDSHNG
mmetsp:Transcript_10189/g.30141  ORF Transcript_10189/g.30141 Transcript_10189/m.30141 type:complete len:528 (-) Transcript_10189:171-1754(-)